MNKENISIREFNKNFDHTWFDNLNISTNAKKILEATKDTQNIIIVSLEESKSIGCKYEHSGDKDMIYDDNYCIECVLSEGDDWGKQTEMILESLIAMKENPKLTVREALIVGSENIKDKLRKKLI